MIMMVTEKKTILNKTEEVLKDFKSAKESYVNAENDLKSIYDELAKTISELVELRDQVAEQLNANNVEYSNDSESNTVVNKDKNTSEDDTRDENAAKNNNSRTRKSSSKKQSEKEESESNEVKSETKEDTLESELDLLAVPNENNDAEDDLDLLDF